MMLIKNQSHHTKKCLAVPLAMQGFTYLGLLFLIALIGLISTAAVTVGNVVQQRAAEEELLFIGSEFRRAIQSYYQATPAGQKPFPTTLNELLQDPRYPNPVRHLRKIYIDPITGKPDWELIPAPEGGVMGIHSKSQRMPIKISQFDAENTQLENKEKYSEWVFFYHPSNKQLAPKKSN